MPDLTRMRRDYGPAPFTEATLAATWVEQFDRWFADAVAAGLPEPNAAVLATADADGAPDARIVLLKGYDSSGLLFATSYASAKGAQLAANPRAALVLPWHALHRQVRLAGRVERLADAAADALWDPRPRGAQLAAAASVQSTVVGSREELVERVRLLDERSPAGPLPRPAAWGGYRVVPDRVEFWQGGTDRLHDRLRFRRTVPVAQTDEGAGEGTGTGAPVEQERAQEQADGGWVVERLAP